MQQIDTTPETSLRRLTTARIIHFNGTNYAQ